MRWMVFSAILVLLHTSTAFTQGSVIVESFYSQSLNRQQDIQVYLPEGYDPSAEYPVVYYLHGAFNGPYAWPYIPTILDDMIGTETIRPMIFVRPDGNAGSFGGSYWVNSGLYGDFEDYIVQDLTQHIQVTYTGASSLAEYRAIMGHSMGGGGAMHAALKHHEFYRAVASHSGILNYVGLDDDWVPATNAEYPGGPPYNYNPGAGIFSMLMFLMSGAHSWNLESPPYLVDFLLAPSTGQIIPSVFDRWLAFDPLTLAGFVPLGTNLRIYFDCGTSDEFFMLPFNEAFDSALNRLGLPHVFETYQGNHTNGLVDRIRQALQFIDDAFPEPTTVEGGGPSELAVLENYPNPFNPSTIVSFSVSRPQKVNISVFDMAGRRITDIADQVFVKGQHTAEWNGRDSSGWSVPSGAYFIRLETDSGVEARKVMLVR